MIRGFLRKISTILLTVLVITVSLFMPVRPATAISNTPTYVLGVTNPLDPLIVDLKNLTTTLTILPSITDLSLVGGNSILFVDGSWLATASSLNPTVLSTVSAKTLSSVPTVVVGGSPAILSQSISKLLLWHAPSLPLISEGLQITGTSQNGVLKSVDLQITFGFDYAVKTEFNWANNQLAQAPTGTIAPSFQYKVAKTITGSTSLASPFWVQVSKLTLDNGNPPHGHEISTFTVYELDNSGSSQYGWYNVFINQTIMPGIEVYNSAWRTADEVGLVHNLNTSSTVLVAHGPSNVFNAGPLVVNYNIGVTARVSGANVTSYQSQSYTLKHTNVTDTSQPPDVSWDHSIDARTSAGTLTFTVIPGVTVRWLLSSRPQVELGVQTTFVQLSGSNVVGTATITYGAFPG